jgi:hypothetical protein
MFKRRLKTFLNLALFLGFMAVCDKCCNNGSFGKKCWYFWEGKKRCSQFRKSFDDEPSFIEEIAQDI